MDRERGRKMEVANLVNLLWWKLLISLGIKRSALPIPDGMYCYTPDVERNRSGKDWRVYYIKPCKYYKALWGRYNGCSYLGIITDDIVFADQCKLCSRNE